MVAFGHLHDSLDEIGGYQGLETCDAVATNHKAVAKTQIGILTTVMVNKFYNYY